jgi:hypothetical protein
MVVAYIPLPLECLQIAKSSRNGFICEVRLVLLEQSATCLGIIPLWNGVFKIGFLDRIKSNDYAIYLGQGIVEVSFGIVCRQLDLLRGSATTGAVDDLIVPRQG